MDEAAANLASTDEALTGPAYNIQQVLPRIYTLIPEAAVDTAGREQVVERIRARSPEDLAANAARAISGIESFYAELNSEGLDDRIHPSGTPHTQAVETLRQRAEQFQQEFEQSIFGTVVHSGPSDLGSTADLKSPRTLAREAGKDLGEATYATGAKDIVIGNDDYVFANSEALPSRSLDTSTERQLYRIQTDEGFVVPTDIAEMRPTDAQIATIVEGGVLPGWPHERIYTGDFAVLDLGLYAANIYTIRDFTRVFALYNAALFATPQEALTFYENFATIPRQNLWSAAAKPGGEGWFSQKLNRWTNIGERDTAMAMMHLQEQYQVTPPFAPEFQFKGHVVGMAMDPGLHQ